VSVIESANRASDVASETDLSTLWRPIRFGPVESRNRVMFSAHATWHEPERYAAYLGARAKGGAGAIFTGAMCVHPSSHNGWINAWEPETAAHYRGWVDAVHEHGSILVPQLHHMGLQGTPAQTFAMMSNVVSPSGGMSSPMWGHFGHELRKPEIAEMVDYFARSAEIAREGGMDGVEIHAAHGYLLFSFLSPLTNQRTDEYGGSVENRSRIVVETIRAVRARVGDDYMVGLKYGFDEKVGPLGITPEDAQACLRFIASETNIDYVSLSGSGYHALQQLVPTAESELSGHMAEYGPLVREVVGDIPIMATCGVRTIDQAAEIVASGKVDVVGMVRPQLADPELVNKAKSGRKAEIRPCVGANQGCWRRMGRGGQITCTVNPESGREAEWKDVFNTAAEPGRVLVIGGGPAGLKAAESAARRGHQVLLVERENELGGQLRAAGALPGRAQWLRLISSLTDSIDRLGVKVRLGVDATPDTAREFGADMTVVATGSHYAVDGFSIYRPDRRSIPGLESIRVLDPATVIADPTLAGARTLIVDDHGAHLAMGLAELLAVQGRHVELITAHGQIGHDTGLKGSVDFPTMYPRLIAAGVRCTAEATVERIEGSTVELAHTYGAWARTLTDIDSIILSQTRRPDDALYDILVEAGLAVELIGDAYAPRDVDEAIYEGALSAIDVHSNRTLEFRVVNAAAC
jgi:2,4-dienoyl-CoA reductase-like NADH-dependent reductase (Old Yellow Enzyme family)